MIVRGAVLSFVLCAASAAAAQPAEIVERGRQLYEFYCMSCHGPKADGKSATALPAGVEPADLRRISARNGGSFPLDKVYRTIDGRDPALGHRPRGMPIWGLTLQELDRDADQEDEVRGKILQLIEYLKSIQVGVARKTPTAPDP